MKKKDLKDLHQKSQQDLQGLMKKAQEELVKLKMDRKAGRLKNIRLPEGKRHDLARIKTVLREKELSL
jgi:ribosomal protein L29